MNEPNGQDQLDSWKALQVELGLAAADAPAAHPHTPRVEARTPPERRVELPAAEAPEPDEPIRSLEQELPQSIVDAQPVESTAADEMVDTADAPIDNNVEVGEAPEEVPEPEPTPDDEKRRRRRRRRRGRRRGGETPGEDEGAAEAPDGADGSPGSETLEGEEDSADDGDAGEEEDDDDGDVEPITFTDWNVPTWQELIASLYRPER